MARGPLWTKQEDKVLLSQVRKNPNNLKEAFRKTANILEGRNWLSCSKRWYNKYSNCPIENIEAICFTTLSSKTMSVNSKNKSKKTKIYKTNNNLWKKIKDFFKNIL